MNRCYSPLEKQYCCTVSAFGALAEDMETLHASVDGFLLAF